MNDRNRHILLTATVVMSGSAFVHSMIDLLLPSVPLSIYVETRLPPSEMRSLFEGYCRAVGMDNVVSEESDFYGADWQIVCIDYDTGNTRTVRGKTE